MCYCIEYLIKQLAANDAIYPTKHCMIFKIFPEMAYFSIMEITSEYTHNIWHKVFKICLYKLFNLQFYKASEIC
jgi:hypothetical protein